jgi:nitrate/nitrite transport system ATP-binding protein
MIDAYLEIANLVKAYPKPEGEPIRVVDRFNLKVMRGEVVGIIGHSGCGKSTVLTMVAGLNDITSGDIIVDGSTIAGAGPDRAVVFQSPCLLPWLTTLDNVMLGVRQVYPHATRAQKREICAHYLAQVGLGEHLHRYPGELSGGMQQRVGIARAIALKPKILLLDEPFGRLDALTRQELQDVILGILAQSRITTMVITHDVDEAVYMCDRIVMMTNGPRAKVGQILDVPFPRPRERAAILEDDLAYDLRAALMEFLAKFDRHGQTAAAEAPQPGRDAWSPVSPGLSLARDWRPQVV